MEFIDSVVYINLEHRQDRRVAIEQEFAKMGITGAKRFNAIIHVHGLIGCMESHLEVLKLAKKNKYKNILIFEDDFQFLVSKEELDSELRTVLSGKNPMPYDVLMLGYNIQSAYIFTPNLLKVVSAQTASAYIVHESFYDKLIECYMNALPMLKTTKLWDMYANDQVWKVLQPRSKWYAFSKRIVLQRVSFSDTTGRIEDYGV